MSDKTPFNFTEIDIDYASHRSEEQRGFMPRRIEKKREWILSLLFPILSAAVMPVLYICGFAFPFMSALFGIGIGGVLPIVMIVRGKTNTSEFFVGKLILLTALIADFFLTIYTDWYDYNVFVVIAPSVVVLAAEGIYAITRKTDGKTKTALFLSSFAWGFLGCLLDFELLASRF